jgi:hypothetical protein
MSNTDSEMRMCMCMGAWVDARKHAPARAAPRSAAPKRGAAQRSAAQPRQRHATPRHTPPLYAGGKACRATLLHCILRWHACRARTL